MSVVIGLSTFSVGIRATAFRNRALTPSVSRCARQPYCSVFCLDVNEMTSSARALGCGKEIAMLFRGTDRGAPYIVSEQLPSWLHFLHLHCFILFFFLILPNSPGEPRIFLFHLLSFVLLSTCLWLQHVTPTSLNSFLFLPLLLMLLSLCNCCC